MKVKTLIRLAYSNLYSHKRTYCLMGAIIILISSILMCAQILYTNQYYTQKKIDQDNYGTWFLMYVDIDEKNFNDNVNEINHLKLGENYHFIRNYGTTQYLENIGKIHDNAFNQFGIHLIDINKEDLIEKKGITSVIVNKQFFENHQLSQKVNQTVSLEFTDINNQKKFMDIYISGIYESKEHLRQKNLPSIISISDVDKYPYKTNGFIDRYIVDDYIQFSALYENSIGKNNLGYEAGNMGAYLEMYDILKFMIICISIGSVVILGISYSSLKSRSKDLTLLRGIGATKKQLFFMITLEGFIIYIVSQFIAILLSVGICYLIMNVFYSSSYYQSIIYNDAIIICSIFSLILIFVSFLLPLLSTLKNALTGTFDHSQFQYFQVRYKKLKKQNTAQIAYRSLMTKKRFTFILILTLTCTIHYLSSWYYAITVETKERDNILEVMPSLYRTITIYGIDEKIPLELIQNMRTYSQNIQAFPLQSLSTEDCNNNLGSNDYITNNYYLSVITPDYLKTIKNIEFDGRFPEKDDEVFITDLSYYQNVDNGNILSETLTYKMGDTVKIKGKTMKIVGYIKPQEISFTRDNQNYNYEDCYFNQYTLYVTKQAYHDLSGKSPDQVEYIKAFYDDSNYNELSSVIEKYKNKNLIINDSAESIDYLTKIVTKNFDQYIEELSIMSLSIVCGAIIIYAFMNKYDIQNNKKEYMLLKIIGTTKKEFYKIQLKKALMMTSVSMILNLITLYLQYGFSINLVLYSFILFIIILTIIFILYVIPIHSLLKQDPIEVMGIEE